MLIMLTPSRPSRVYNNDNAADVDTDSDPTFAGVVGRNDQSIVKKRFMEISEIQPVLFEVGETLRLVPNDFHDLFVATIYYDVK